MTQHGFGIAGCGGAAADMAAAIEQLPEARVSAVFDRVETRAQELAAAGGATVHTSLDALLADDGVDVVYVGLPHHLLAPTAAAALHAGRHALVEKPVALDVASVQSLKRVADERGLVVAPVFELRTGAVAREARRLVAAGAIGEVTAVRIRTVIDKPQSYWQSGPKALVADSWRARRDEAGGGVVLMNSVHQLDLVRYVTGLSFTRASAEIATLHADVEVEDSAAAALRLSNGGVVSLVAAAHSPGAADEERIEIDGAAGRIDLPDPTGSARTRLRVFRDGAWETRDAGESDTYLELLRSFVGALDDGTPPAATADDAAAALATVLAIYAAAHERRSVTV